MHRERGSRTLKLNQRRRELLKALGLAGLGFGLGMLVERAIAHPQIEKYYLHKYSGVQPYSYMIFKEGDTYYAKNGKTGEIKFEDDDASEVIQSAIDSLPEEGGKIFIKKGVYDINSTIRAEKAFLVIEGEGTWDRHSSWELTNAPQRYMGTMLVSMKDGLTIFDLGWEADAPMRVIMERLTFIPANYNYQPNTTAIYLRGKVRHSVFRMLWFDSMKYGILEDDSEGYLQDVWFEKLTSEHTDTLLYLTGGYNIRLLNSYCGWQESDTYVVSMRSISGKIVSVFVDNLWLLGSNPPHTTSYRGLLIEGGDKSVINNVIANNPFEGIVIAVVHKNTSMNNIVINGSLESSTGAILIDAEYATLSNIIIRTPTIDSTVYRPRYGIYIRGSTYPSGKILARNIFIEDYTVDIFYVPSGVMLQKNGVIAKNLLTENSGTVTITGDGTTTTFTVDIEHGLVKDKVACKITLDRDGSIDKVYLVDTEPDGFYETIRVVVTYASAPASGEEVPIYWSAEVVE